MVWQNEDLGTEKKCGNICSDLILGHVAQFLTSDIDFDCDVGVLISENIT